MTRRRVLIECAGFSLLDPDAARLGEISCRFGVMERLASVLRNLLFEFSVVGAHLAMAFTL
jgi:hypothetical protein